MSENSAAKSASTQPSVATSTLRPLQKARRMLPMLAMAGVFALTLWLALAKNSPIYALITPPHTPDFIASGDTLVGDFGFSVESAGDVNDDGFGDIIVGADTANTIYVYTGSTTGLTTTVFFSDTGNPLENLGWSVGGDGDVNGDGVSDLLAGTPISGAGSVYVYHGSSVGLPTQVATLTGEFAGDNFGWSVAMIGDVNDDGIDDVAVGAPTYGISNTGVVYVYYGALNTGVPLVASVVISGEAADDGFGVSVAKAGDVNGDGIGDLAVGAWQNDDGGSDAGKAYLFYGSPSGPSQLNYDSVVGVANSLFGTSVHGAGDVNGDGFADLIVGADATDPGDPTPGYFSIFPGGPTGLISTPLLTQQGESDNDRFGFAVTGDGDLDGDGFSDFGVGAYDFDVVTAISTTNEGKAYAYVACTNGAIAPSRIFSATGEAAFDNYGHSLSIVKDVNADGIDDLVVGAYVAKNSVPLPTGEIYAYYGVAGGCRPAVEVTKTVSLANFPALFTNTTVITVPTDTVVRYTYQVRNGGNVTLTQQTVVDDKLGIVTETAYTLIPGANFSVNVTDTPGVSATPGISITNVVTWTGSQSITSPSGVTTPTNRTLGASATTSALVNISGPSTDQDGDGIPDNLEGSKDPDSDGLPNYLDINSDGDDFPDAVEAGPNPTTPVDRDEDGIPGYLDPDENPNTVIDTPITGLAIDGPSQGLVGDPATFVASVTGGSNPITYTWNFGDSGTGIGSSVTHTYTTPGFYIVVVTAENALGTQEANKSITILYSMLLPRIMTTGVQE